MKVYVNSDIGCVRENNEDSYICNPPHLLVVADGMGGHVAGEIASNLAVTTIKEYVTEKYATMPITDMLSQAIIEANRKIFSLSQEKEMYNGMGTTVSAVYVEGANIYWAHVGDSRIYLFQKGNLVQLTKDHSLVWELVELGSITKNEAKNHPQRNVLTRAVGTAEKLKVDVGNTNWIAGSDLLLCTDGLTSLVSENQILDALSNACGDKVLENLISLAKASGGYDNITVILARHGDE